MTRLSTIAFLLLFTLTASAATFTTNGPSTTNNDDSCDIGLFPAATLLLPYFEVADQPGQETTIFTVTNTGHLPQSVRVTLWTDYGYPVIDFPMYLTGYDVQSINLYDIIIRGQIAPPRGTGSDVSPVGELSGENGQDHDNPQLDEASCTGLPVALPSVYINRMRSAFTQGIVPAIGSSAACERVGGVHTRAIGYATVDVVGACTSSLPTDAVYFANEIRFDNVLIGDYLQVDGTNDYAQGNPMVHIRAIPEGGSPATHKPTNMPVTFYSYLNPAAARTRDGRQPLPSTFAARWIEGGGAGFETFYKIWRGIDTAANANCSEYDDNADMIAVEVVRFDEEENPETSLAGTIADPPQEHITKLPAASRISVDSPELIPPSTQGAVGGWIYFNLNDRGNDELAKQNWVVVSMRAEGRFSADMDAIQLGNGCTPATPLSEAVRRNGQPIGPAPNTN